MRRAERVVENMSADNFDEEVLEATRANREKRKRWIKDFDRRKKLRDEGVYVASDSRGFRGMAHEKE